MTKFKVGDKVERIKYSHAFTPMIIGSQWVVSSVHHRWIRVEGYDQPLDPEYFKLIEEAPFPLCSEEQAVKLLTEAGYTVNPPKPKLTGKVYVYANLHRDMIGTQIITTTPPELFNKWREDSPYPLLAVVNWTEGDGI